MRDSIDSAVTSLASAISGLLQEPDMADWTLVCGDRDWKVHSLILATRSPFFKAAMSNDTVERRQKKIEIWELDPESIENVVKYMYGKSIYSQEGDISDVDSLFKMIEAADRFLMDDFKNYVLGIIDVIIDAENVIEIGLLAEDHEIDSLMETCVDFIVSEDLEVNVEDLSHKFAQKMVSALQNQRFEIGPTYLKLTVVPFNWSGRNRGALRYTFRVKSNTPLGKIRKSLCEDGRRFDLDAVDFWIDDRKIHDNETLEDIFREDFFIPAVLVEDKYVIQATNANEKIHAYL